MFNLYIEIITLIISHLYQLNQIVHDTHLCTIKVITKIKSLSKRLEYLKKINKILEGEKDIAK